MFLLVSSAWPQETDAKARTKEWVESGLDHFLSTCAEALQDRDSYIAGLGKRDGMVANGVSDDQKVRAVRYQPFEPGSRSGWIEQSLFSEDEGTTRTTCVVAGFNTAFPTTEEIDVIFTEWLAEKLPGATVVGGILSAAPGASFDAGPAVPSVSYRMVTNWTDDPELVLFANLFTGEFIITGNRDDGETE